MTVPQDAESTASEEVVDGWWSADVDVSRTPSPGIPAKRMRMTLDDIAQEYFDETVLNDDELNLSRVRRTPESLGYGSGPNFRALWTGVSSRGSSSQTMDSQTVSQSASLPPDGPKKMQTGCIPCLYVQTPMTLRIVAC